MTDALWNGIIGAGGAAICCTVYFGFKAARKGISKIKFSKTQSMPKTTHEQVNLNTAQTSSPKQVTITLPTKKQIFTRRNIRSTCFLIIAAYAISAAYKVGMEHYPPEPSLFQSFYTPENASFYDYTTSQLDVSLRLDVELIRTIRGCFFWICWLFALVMATLGLTGFSFKKNGDLS